MKVNLKNLAKYGFPEHINEQIRRKAAGGNSSTRSSSNVELPSKLKPVRSYAGSSFDTPVRVDIYSTRIRKTDIDGISGKAALDGIVDCGVLKDDSPDQIVSYQVHKPEISKEEKTIIVIEEI